MSTSDFCLHCCHLHHHLLQLWGNLDHPTPWRVFTLSWQQSWPVWEVLENLPPSFHSLAVAFHSQCDMTDQPLVRLLTQELNFFCLLSDCLWRAIQYTAAGGGRGTGWREMCYCPPSQHQQLLPLSSGLPSTLSSCPHLIFIFHRRLSFSMSHGSFILPRDEHLTCCPFPALQEQLGWVLWEPMGVLRLPGDYWSNLLWVKEWPARISLALVCLTCWAPTPNTLRPTALTPYMEDASPVTTCGSSLVLSPLKDFFYFFLKILNFFFFFFFFFLDCLTVVICGVEISVVELCYMSESILALYFYIH